MKKEKKRKRRKKKREEEERSHCRYEATGQNYSEMKEDRKKRSLQYNKRDITGLWLIWSRKFKRLKAF